MRERVEAMKAIWTQEEASYAGEHVAFERIWSEPKPAQRPHPPILVGGARPDGPRSRARVRRRLAAQLRRRRALLRPASSELQARAERPVEVTVLACRPTRASSSACATRASAAPCTGCRPGAAASSSRARALGGGDRASSTASDRRAGAASLRRRDRGAPGDRRRARPAASRPDRVRPSRRDDLQRGRRQAQAHDARCAASPTSPPTRTSAVLVDHYERGLGLAVVGARRRRRPACSTRRRPRLATPSAC